MQSAPGPKTVKGFQEWREAGRQADEGEFFLQDLFSFMLAVLLLHKSIRSNNAKGYTAARKFTLQWLIKRGSTNYVPHTINSLAQRALMPGVLRDFLDEFLSGSNGQGADYELEEINAILQARAQPAARQLRCSGLLNTAVMRARGPPIR